MKHMPMPIITPSRARCLFVLAGGFIASLVLTGCSGFLGPDARMGRPEAQLLSSGGGVIPQPGTLGNSAPAAPSSYNSAPATPPTLPSNQPNPYANGFEPFEPEAPSSPVMEYDEFENVADFSADDDDEYDELPSVPETSPALSHKVRKGESLWSISRNYGVSMSELAAYNDMQKDDILPADKMLTIPPGGTAPERLENGTTEAATDDDNDDDSGASSANAAATAHTPSGGESIPADGKYIVQSGDSLWKISRRFGVSIDNLREWNDLQSDVLQLGRVLLLRPPDTVGTIPTDDPMRPPRDNEVEQAGDGIFGRPGDSVAEPDEDTDDAANGSAGLTPAGDTAVNYPQTLEHTVSPGETLQDIATMYETSVEAIKQANPGVQAGGNLEQGKQLVIPFE